MDITAISVNFKTPDLIANCRDTFAQYYPDLIHILIDNGGCAESLAVLREIKDRDNKVVLLENLGNAGHGPALNQGLALTGTRYAFLLDSDTEIQQGGFLEKMLAKFSNVQLFAVGWLRWTNERGLAVHERDVERVQHPERQWLPYIHPYACLLDTVKFRELEPFAKTGAPATNLMRSAREHGYSVADFPIDQYIWHKGAGTRALFDGQIRPATRAEPGQWRKMPI